MSLTSDIRDYDPQWPALFDAERLKIQEELGHLVREIHHVGSTAVPGMNAKPEIDLLIVVKSIGDIDAINSGMAELGYDVRGECGIEGRHYYSKDIRSARTHKAHVCEISHSNVVRQVEFKRNGGVPGREAKLHRTNHPHGSSPRLREIESLTRGLRKTRRASPLAHRVRPPHAVRSQASIHMSEKFWSNFERREAQRNRRPIT